MGCGVSRFDQTVVGGGGGASQLRPFSGLIHKKNGPSIANDSLLMKPKPKPENQSEGEDNAKGGGGGKVYCDHYHQEQNYVEDDGHQSLPQSLSFRVYCTTSLEDDNRSQGDSSKAENMAYKQEGDVDHRKKDGRVVDHHKNQEGDGDINKGSTHTRSGKLRARIGKGIKGTKKTSESTIVRR